MVQREFLIPVVLFMKSWTSRNRTALDRKWLRTGCLFSIASIETNNKETRYPVQGTLQKKQGAAVPATSPARRDPCARVLAAFRPARPPITRSLPNRFLRLFRSSIVSPSRPSFTLLCSRTLRLGPTTFVYPPFRLSFSQLQPNPGSIVAHCPCIRSFGIPTRHILSTARSSCPSSNPRP